MLQDIRTFLPPVRQIRRYRRREYLFRRIEERFVRQPERRDAILDIFDRIRDTHRGQPRRKNEESRLIHEREMAGHADLWGVHDPLVYINIGGHDGPEDYRRKGWTFRFIQRTYGPVARKEIRALTNPDGLEQLNQDTVFEILRQQWRSGSPRVLFTKGIDRVHYFRNPWSGWESKMVLKYQETYLVLVPEMVRVGLDVQALTRAANAAMDRLRKINTQ